MEPLGFCFLSKRVLIYPKTNPVTQTWLLVITCRSRQTTVAQLEVRLLKAWYLDRSAEALLRKEKCVLPHVRACCLLRYLYQPTGEQAGGWGTPHLGFRGYKTTGETAKPQTAAAYVLFIFEGRLMPDFYLLHRVHMTLYRKLTAVLL
jgi:hypothetical protein